MAITATLAPDAAGALQMASAFLHSDPVRHNVILSVLSEPEPTDTALVLHDNGDVVGVAMVSRARTAVSLTRIPNPAIESLVDAIGALDPPETVTGPVDTVARFVNDWSTRLGRSAVHAMDQLLYEAGNVLAPPRPALGRYRAATLDDLDTMVAIETGSDPIDERNPKTETVRTLLTRRLADNQIRVWDVDGTMVSKVRHSPPIAGATRLSAVYTPERHRRHGYSAAVVGALTRELLDAGLRPLLYTDRSYVPANRLYAGLGYEIVETVADYTLGR